MHSLIIPQQLPLLQLLALPAVLVYLRQVVVPIVGDSNNLAILDGANCPCVYESELGEAPFRVEVAGQHPLHEAEHALCVRDVLSSLGIGL
ncbi:MAG: hypothetical protein ACMG6E_10540 [Candidatus Roizmanbacteria bacterium]